MRKGKHRRLVEGFAILFVMYLIIGNIASASTSNVREETLLHGVTTWQASPISGTTCAQLIVPKEVRVPNPSPAPPVTAVPVAPAKVAPVPQTDAAPVPPPGAPPGGTPQQHPMLDMLKKADTDNDGKVTFEEMKAIRPQMTKEQFDMRDRNKDGVLTAADFPSPADLFKEADKDGDGKVIFEEMNAVRPLPKERFDMMDKNKDGVLTPDEMRMGPRPGGMMGHVSGMGLR